MVGSRRGWAASIETMSDPGVGQLAQEVIVLGFRRARMHMCIAEADVERRHPADAFQRPIDRLDRIGSRGLGARLKIRFVQLHNEDAGRVQILNLLVDGGGVVHRQRLVIRIVIVLCLLRHRERPGQGDLGPAIRAMDEVGRLASLDRTPAPDSARYARHRIGGACPIKRFTQNIDVDSLEGSRQAIGIAFTAHLTVADDVDARQPLVAQCHQGGG